MTKVRVCKYHPAYIPSEALRPPPTNECWHCLKIWDWYCKMARGEA